MRSRPRIITTIKKTVPTISYGTRISHAMCQSWARPVTERLAPTPLEFVRGGRKPKERSTPIQARDHLQPPPPPLSHCQASPTPPRHPNQLTQPSPRTLDSTLPTRQCIHAFLLLVGCESAACELQRAVPPAGDGAASPELGLSNSLLAPPLLLVPLEFANPNLLGCSSLPRSAAPALVPTNSELLGFGSHRSM